MLAQIIASKFADHPPLYCQSQIYAREGVEISRSTMAGWLDQAGWLQQPLIDRIADHVMGSVKLYADDTPVPVLAPGIGKTATGRLWVYLRDNRRWSHLNKPTALFCCKGDRPREHLKTFAGFLQPDAYARFQAPISRLLLQSISPPRRLIRKGTEGSAPALLHTVRVASPSTEGRRIRV